MNSMDTLHRPYGNANEGESAHSPFLTDREAAEATAATALGPLAVVAFETRPTLGLMPVHEAAEPVAAEVPSTIPDTIGEFNTSELLTVMRRQRNVARASLLFATRTLN